MSSAKPKRSERIGELIRSELMALLLRGAVRDPGASEVTVTHVRVTDDLQHATVYVRLVRDGVGAEQAKAAVDALDRARGFLRRELAPRLAMKRQPDLEFRWDEQIDAANRIEQLLGEISRESAGRGPGASGDGDS